MAVLAGTLEDDALRGTNAADRISGLAGNDVIRGLGGHDVLLGDSGDDQLLGNAGDDRLFGGDGNDELQGGLGNDILNGGPGNDRLFGQAGNDQLAGGDGTDRLRGGDGADQLAGGAGNDALFGEAGDDRLSGDAGNDVLDGGDGRDVLRGGAGNDTLRGGNGNDTLLGGLGTDVLLGGAGDDVLNGGPGSDTLTGGPGSDVYAFGSAAHGLDTITDFNLNEDRFDLTVALQRFDSGKDIEDFVQYRATDEGTVLALDANGSGASYTDVALMQGVSVASLPLEQLGLTLTPDVSADPIPTRIVPGDIVVDIVDFAQVPRGVIEPPLARINGMFHADDGSGRLFVNDTRGPMYVIEDGVLNTTPMLNLRTELPNEWFVGNDLWDGFRDFAFHPDFENPGTAGFGKLYVSYTASVASAALHPDTHVFPLNRPDDPNGIRHHDVIAEFDVNPTTLDVDIGSYRELMRIENPHTHHNVGELAFNPNARPGDADYGKLHASIGDAQFGDGEFYPFEPDPLDVGQDRGVLPGSIIRIDPLQAGSSAYTVPADNPFVGEAGVLPEIWAYGLRHPQYFSWDTGGDGKMIIGEIGETKVEQLELGVAGANYGWSEREGTFVIDQGNSGAVYELPPWDALRGFTYPVLQYDHDEGDAIATGYVYRGDNIPELQGKYIFGDLSNGRIFYVDVDDLELGQTVTEFNELRLRYNGVEQSLTDIIGQRLGVPTTRAELRFGQDEDGEVYILSKWDGMIRALAPSGGTGGPQTASAGDTLRTEDVLDGDGPLLADLPPGSGASIAATAAGPGFGDGAVAGPQLLDELLGPAAHA